MELARPIETSRICHTCGIEWKLPYSILKEIILARRSESVIKGAYISDYTDDIVICKTCPSCSVDMCVYHDNPAELKPFIPKKLKMKAFKCTISGHDFKGNIRHHIYTCKKCNQVIKYKDSKIFYLN